MKSIISAWYSNKMVFDIGGKIVLVTGGASGIGLEQARTLLRKGAKGVTIADISDKGEDVVKGLQDEFGKERVIFVHTNVVNKNSFENAFKVTLKEFQNIDILINNAGICNEDTWELAVDINVKGTINGIMLGLEYLKDHMQGDEAIIVNTSSVTGIGTNDIFPVYGGTKYAINGLTRNWGTPGFYQKTKVRVVCICPDLTDTPLANKKELESVVQSYKEIFGILRPETVAEETAKVIEKAPNGSIWAIENGGTYEYIYPDKESYKNNVLTS